MPHSEEILGENAEEDLGWKGSPVLTVGLNPKLSAPDVCAILMGVVSFIIFFLILKGNEILVKNIVQEDGFIENLTAFFWIEASIICVYLIATSSQKNKSLLYFWAVFCFICFGEEISWGQRIFGYSLHFVQGTNVQHEINLHNLKAFFPDTKFTEVLGGTIHWWKLVSLQRLFYLGFMIYFLFFPFLSKLNRLKSLKVKLNYIAPSHYFIISTWSVIIFSFIEFVRFTDVAIRKDAISETQEMFFAFVVLFYIIFYLRVDPRHNPQKC